MSLSVAILTPNPTDPSFQGRWSQARDRMVTPLAAEGITVETQSWTEDADTLGAHDLVLPMFAWGYHRDYDLWLARTEGWEMEGVRIRNPAGVLRWNASKTYLERLQVRGAPVAPTLFVDDIHGVDLHDAARRLGAEQLIVKPQVSASAYRTLRLRPGDELVDPPTGAAMIQPYLAAVEGEGEISLLFFDGQFSHAIRKVAASGDFRVQPEWGGQITALEPEPDVLAAAQRILAAVDEPLLYARVDLVRDAAGKPLLMELELIEPDLYLDFDPARGAGFARAVRRAAEA